VKASLRAVGSMAGSLTVAAGGASFAQNDAEARV
jgi:hypothetical protein